MQCPIIVPSQFIFHLLESVFNPGSQGVLRAHTQKDVAAEVAHDKPTIRFIGFISATFGDLVVAHSPTSAKNDLANVAPLSRVLSKRLVVSTLIKISCVTFLSSSA